MIDAARQILSYTGRGLRGEMQPDRPTGRLNCVANNHRAKELLRWEPMMRSTEGLRRTIDWHCEHKDPEQVRLLLERGGPRRVSAATREASSQAGAG